MSVEYSVRSNEGTFNKVIIEPAPDADFDPCEGLLSKDLSRPENAPHWETVPVTFRPGFNSGLQNSDLGREFSGVTISLFWFGELEGVYLERLQPASSQIQIYFAQLRIVTRNLVTDDCGEAYGYVLNVRHAFILWDRYPGERPEGPLRLPDSDLTEWYQQLPIDFGDIDIPWFTDDEEEEDDEGPAEEAEPPIGEGDYEIIRVKAYSIEGKRSERACTPRSPHVDDLYERLRERQIAGEIFDLEIEGYIQLGLSAPSCAWLGGTVRVLEWTIAYKRPLTTA